MKATIELLKIYHNALVDTIQYLDQIGHSDTGIRHKVDVALNHLDKFEPTLKIYFSKKPSS